MNKNFAARIASEVEGIKTAGLFKNERVITSEQGAEIIVNGTMIYRMSLGTDVKEVSDFSRRGSRQQGY
ncbi:MAG: hypothetical protein EOO03_12015, partial [Chitinophagaceae bacterium]